MQVAVQSLHQDEYLLDLFGRDSRSGARILRSYAARMHFMLTCKRVDVVWLEKELWPYMPASFEWALLQSKAPYVVDIDDAIFHNYDEHRSKFVRAMFGRKLDYLFKGAALVTAGSRYLEERARSAGATRIERIPTVVDLDAYRMRSSAPNGTFTVGWIGSPVTQRYLEPIRAVLCATLGERASRFVTVGARFSERLFAGHEQQSWSEETEAQQIASFDVGIMPLPDSPFERGKCAYKLIQYMACGIPVVASPIGANQDVVRHGENGFLASTDREWASALSALAEDPELRRRMGAAGRADVETKYSIQVTGPRIANLMLDVMSNKARSSKRLRAHS